MRQTHWVLKDGAKQKEVAEKQAYIAEPARPNCQTDFAFSDLTEKLARRWSGYSFPPLNGTRSHDPGYYR